MNGVKITVKRTERVKGTELGNTSRRTKEESACSTLGVETLHLEIVVKYKETWVAALGHRISPQDHSANLISFRAVAVGASRQQPNLTKTGNWLSYKRFGDFER